MSSATTTIVELMGGIVRFFPNSILISLLVIGFATSNMSWVLVSIGGIVTMILTILLQHVLSQFFSDGKMPGVFVVEACSSYPGGTEQFTNFPSLWITLSTFFATYIFTNAFQIYSEAPAPGVSLNKISVQQRKSMGLISMVAVSILFIFLLMARYNTSCESIGGLLISLLFGMGCGYAWWRILCACPGSSNYADIHGVTIGLRPGVQFQ